ncbi:MAG: VWA domain-containing protein [Gemmatimonadota bacterium]
MSEPEEVILDGAHHATTTIASLWRRHMGTEGTPEVRLTDVKHRLELLTRAVFGTTPPIGVAEPPAVPNWFGRVALRIPNHMVRKHAVAWTDGMRIRLPATLDAPDGEEEAIARYRAWTMSLAARCRRGTPDFLSTLETDGPGPHGRLVRDLFLLSEAVSSDRDVARDLPGLRSDLSAARRYSLAKRPHARVLTGPEEQVERIVAEALASDPTDGPSTVPHAQTPSDSLAWATTMAAELESRYGDDGKNARYRGIPPVEAWGIVEPLPDAALKLREAGIDPLEEDETDRSNRIRTLSRRPRIRQAPEDEDDDQVGMWMVQIDDPQESVEDPMGLQRPTDRDDDADPGDLADSLSELPEARVVPVPGTPKEILASDDPPERTTMTAGGVPNAVGISYPEWDYRVEQYLPGRAIVRARTAPEGDAAWADAALKQHGREVRRVRRQFERLRPNRTRLGRQTDGPDIDLGAYVTAYADRKAGHALEDRLYEEVRPARRDLSILLLVDVSGSTDSWVADTRRIVDVEKEALLLVCEALDALGDPYGVLAFSGEGPRGVSVATVKGFDERNGRQVRARISALEPDRFTRTGAAIRHATAQLGARSSRHRLLLVLSDGKPNDIDLYEGRYGIEDTRQAVAEARLEGLDAFCVTVDRHAPEYLPRIFGPTGYAVLRHAAKLPGVLVEVVRLLLRS